MRFFSVLFFASFACHVHASAQAGGYERIFFYFAYQLDFKLARFLHPSNRLICPEVTGPPNIDKPATFKEFIRQISPANTPASQLDNLPDDTSFDINDTAKKMRESGLTSANIDLDKLYPNLQPGPAGKRYFTFMKFAKQRLSDIMDLPQMNNGPAKDRAKLMGECADNVRKIRGGEVANYLYDWQEHSSNNPFQKNSNFVWGDEYVLGKHYYTLDIPASTFDGVTVGDPTFEAAAKKVLDHWETSENISNQAHRDLEQVYRQMATAVATKCT